MKLTRECEIAIGILICCARRPTETVNVRDAATFVNATVHHANRVTVQLVRTGYLESVRGKGGGIRPIGAADQISVGGIIRHMQPQLSPRKTRFENLGLEVLLGEAMDAAFYALDGFTIADLAGTGSGNRFACLTCAARGILRPFHRSKTRRVKICKAEVALWG